MRYVSSRPAMGWIYKLTSPSGKAYIGKTQRRQVEMRFKEHCGRSSKCHAIACAIQKYGFENFVVEKWQYPDEYLVEYEQLFILDHGTLAPDGYNLKSAGHDNKLTSEGKAKQSAKSKERWQDPEHRETMCASMRRGAQKRWEDPESRKAASEAAKKKYEDRPELRDAIGKQMKERWQDPEARERWLRSLGDWSEESRATASASAKKKFEANPDLKQGISGAMKAMWADPEYRERQCAAMTGRRMSEEARAALSAKRRAAWDALPDERKEELKRVRAEGRRRAKAPAREGP